MARRIHLWNLFFSLAFAAIVLWGTSWLVGTGRVTSVPLGDFILMALAVMRLTRLVVYDHILSFMRDWFDGTDARTFRGTIRQLVNCPWCTGLWFAFFVPFFYFATPYAWFIIFVLALAAVGSFLQILANLVGWYAEGKKLEVLAREAR
jgi:hypothetical protein